MALIKCSECSKEISDKAESCPNCGNPNEIQHLATKEAERATLSAKLTEDKFYNIIGAIVIKSIIAIIAIIFIPSQTWGFGTYLMTFLLIYWAASFFPFALRITGNWILAIVAWVIIMLGLAWVFDSIVDPSMDGSLIYDILIYLFFALAIAFDIFRVVRLSKKTKASV